MIDQRRYERIKRCYGLWGSWAVWREPGQAPKSNVGDLSIFNDARILASLNPHVVLVGLNCSRGLIQEPFANFHDARPEATDFKIRHALMGTKAWGGYMTDIVKDYEEKDSAKVTTYLKQNPEFQMSCIRTFQEEVADLGVERPTFIAFGGVVYGLLRNHFGLDSQPIIRIPHYANYVGKDRYREQVVSAIQAIQL